MTEPALKTKMQSHYPDVQPNPDFPKIEEGVLKYWKQDDTFRKSVEQRSATVQGDKGEASRPSEPSASEASRNCEVSRPNRAQSNNEYIFYDGPPFANGLPHYGHLLTGFVKDLYARYHTMKGEKVERRFGWDCHGLPAEMGAEKELGISGRQQIQNFGIDKFNEHCRSSVMKYAGEWETYVNRQARWVDFAGDYKTMDKNFMESVIWAFKQLYDKGLIYQSHRVMPYSWAAETPLSNFETKLDNSYRNRTDKAVTVKFKLKEVPEKIAEWFKQYDFEVDEVSIAAWTTTPWTLPSNLALAASDELQYYAVREDNKCTILSIQAAGQYFPDLVGMKEKDPNKSVNENADEHFKNKCPMSGSDLIGLEYEPLFPYFDTPEMRETAFKVLEGDFIEEGSGTGIVHMAPGFGEDDQRVCAENGIEVVVPVDEQGKYTAEIFDLPCHSERSEESKDPSASPQDDSYPPLSLKGLNVIAQTEGQCKDEPYTPEQLQKYGLANLRIIQWLKANDKLVKQEDYNHNYPHCWRTDMPLIYRAMPSWYVEVTKFRDRAVELNKQINWIPDHIRDGQMAHMLATAPDWSISRNRFWGTPIPIWEKQDGSGERKAFGSIAELEEFFGVEVKDLHRPYIDELKTAKDGSQWQRVSDVFDCWFESGSMPFAQVHYPFENKEWFETHFPADFITEYVGQTRGWFNTLIILATALFDKPPFKNCICHGVVLDAETGLKYSKRLKNYKDPMEVIDQFGADALRWLMMDSPVMRGHDLSVDPEGKFIRDVVRLHIKPIWNAYNFFTLYANADGVTAEFDTSSDNLMDRYILAKCREAVEQVEKGLDAYDTPAACAGISSFFEVLNNWYIRRNKDRFWNEGNSATDQAAYNTLYSVLVTMCKAAAPLLPLTTEEIYRGLTGGDSVHLQDFPKVDSLPNARNPYELDIMILVDAMDKVRSICNSALSVRNKVNIRTRQPLSVLTVYYSESDTAATTWEALTKQGMYANGEYYTSIIADELNVKAVIVSSSLEEVAKRNLAVNARVVGKRLGQKTKEIIPASKRGDWEILEYDDSYGFPSKARVGSEFLHNYSAVGEEGVAEFEFEILLQPKDGLQGAAALSTNDALVVLDLNITPELAAEGLARDFVRMVQEARKNADLHVSNRIALTVQAQGKVAEAIAANKDYIAEQVLATSLELGEVSTTHRFEQELEGEKITFGFDVA